MWVAAWRSFAVYDAWRGRAARPLDGPRAVELPSTSGWLGDVVWRGVR